MAEQQTSAPPQVGPPGSVCCGGRHAPGNERKPLKLACQLCDQAPAEVYWQNDPGFKRRAAANPDAYPYVSQ